MSRLSALIVARNAARDLPACLESVRFADEIVVVLDRCTDESKAVAAAAGARILEGGWEREGPRRNAGIEACAGPWILEIDADERATPALAEEIRGALPGAAPGAFFIPFDNRIGGRSIRYGWGAYNGVGGKRCLFAKGTKHWGDARLHPPVRQEGVMQALKAPMIHDVYRDFPDMFSRLIRYSRLAAEDMVETRAIPSPLKTGRRVLSRFWKSYVARGGRREGFTGWALALYSALYPALSHLFALELRAQRQRERGDEA